MTEWGCVVCEHDGAYGADSSEHIVPGEFPGLPPFQKPNINSDIIFKLTKELTT